MTSTKRIAKEHADLQQGLQSGTLKGFTASPREANLYHWKAEVYGPAGTPYEGGTWVLDVRFPSDYPYKPPMVTFCTKIFHPNIITGGSSSGICGVDILRALWSPAFRLVSVLLCVQSLLHEPNAINPAINPVAAQLLKADPVRYEGMVRSWTALYAGWVPSLRTMAAMRLRSLEGLPESLYDTVNDERLSLGGTPLEIPRKRQRDDERDHVVGGGASSSSSTGEGWEDDEHAPQTRHQDRT